ncbi:MAG: hypothetical protein V3R20_05045 [Sphingomonadales bacterium]
MKAALLFKAIGNCPDTMSTHDNLVRHAKRQRVIREVNLSDRHSNVTALFALQEAV